MLTVRQNKLTNGKVKQYQHVLTVIGLLHKTNADAIKNNVAGKSAIKFVIRTCSDTCSFLVIASVNCTHIVFQWLILMWVLFRA